MHNILEIFFNLKESELFATVVGCTNLQNCKVAFDTK